MSSVLGTCFLVGTTGENDFQLIMNRRRCGLTLKSFDVHSRLVLTSNGVVQRLPEPQARLMPMFLAKYSAMGAELTCPMLSNRLCNALFAEITCT
eukprot:4059770-Amphidinium_carterae.1